MARGALKITFLVLTLCSGDVLCQLFQLFGANPSRFASERYMRSRFHMAARKLGLNSSVSENSDALDFVAMVDEHDYPVEEHLVTTEDGYELHVHRIPGSPDKPKAPGKPVVYFQHGLFSSSDQWILMGPESDFSYMLADAGYDVWLGNIRGNTYSRSHVKLSPDYDGEFWNFSFHEIALFDIPATIDYILKETQQPSLIYVGHSMGGTISNVLLSTKPEYNEKIKLVINLATTVTWLSPHQPTVELILHHADSIKGALNNMKIYELLSLSAATPRMITTLCGEKSMFRQLCAIFQMESIQSDVNMWHNWISSFPAGTSAQSVLHYLQNIESGNFVMYDFGEKENSLKYGQPEPPAYDLSNIVAPVALIYGEGDSIIAPDDVIELSKRLPNVVTIESVPDPKFGHLDFVVAQDIKKLLNNRLLEIMENSLKQ
ncbi:lipase 3-like [Copidosoma floridanum]|uniref:lipase 3-like n=1 Tax=Copidosoma floridanum TaxID=29053 RepID=UPI0006C95B1F|nr:lipase 3-like [Copidosoma floridanum]